MAPPGLVGGELRGQGRRREGTGWTRAVGKLWRRGGAGPRTRPCCHASLSRHRTHEGLWGRGISRWVTVTVRPVYMAPATGFPFLTHGSPDPFVQRLLRAQSCPTLWDPHMDCSPPGSSVHGILQARILEWVVISFPRDLPNPGIKPCLLLGRRDLHRLSHLGAHCAERELISEQLGPTRLQKPRLTRYHREAFAGAVPKPDAGPDGSEDCWALPPRDGSHHLPRGRASPQLCAPQKTTAEAVKPSRS